MGVGSESVEYSLFHTIEFGGDLASTGAVKQAGHAERQRLVKPLDSQI